MATKLLEIEPRELKFIVEPKKLSECSIQLINKSDQYVAFKIKTTSPKKYCVRPNLGVINPGEACDFTVTMQAQRTAPSDWHCKDKFLVESTVIAAWANEEDIPPDTFARDGKKFIEDKKLRVVLIDAATSPSLHTPTSPLLNTPTSPLLHLHHPSSPLLHVHTPRSPLLHPVNGEMKQDQVNEISAQKDGAENVPTPPKIIEDVKGLEIVNDVDELVTPTDMFEPKPSKDIDKSTPETPKDMFKPRPSKDMDISPPETPTDMFKPRPSKDMDISPPETPTDMFKPRPSKDMDISPPETPTDMFKPRPSKDMDKTTPETPKDMFKPKPSEDMDKPTPETPQDIFKPRLSKDMGKTTPETPQDKQGSAKDMEGFENGKDVDDKSRAKGVDLFISTLEPNMPKNIAAFRAKKTIARTFEFMERIKPGMNAEKFKLAHELGVLKSKNIVMDTKLREAEHNLKKLMEERSVVSREKDSLKHEIEILRKSNVRKVEVGFTFMNVCSVALISMTLGYLIGF